MTIYYLATDETADDNVVTEKLVRHIVDTELKVIDYKGYSDHCVLSRNTSTCLMPSSILTQVWDFEAEDLYADWGDRMQIASNSSLPTGGLYSTSTDRSVSPPQSKALRSLFTFALPLEGFKNSAVDFDEQEDLFRTFILKVRDDVLSEASLDNLDVVWIGTVITQEDFDSIIARDGSLAGIAMLVVLLIVGVHTRSAFLTLLGMLHVILSFPIALFLFRYVVGITNFNTLNTLGLFVILAIGADDIFILVDTWKQAPVEALELCALGLRERMTWTYKRAASAMLTTSLTTAVAFLSNVISSIPPIRSFGIFVALLVLSNYFLVITWYPCVLMWWHQGQVLGWKANMVALCCWPCKLDPNAVETSERNRYRNLLATREREARADGAVEMGDMARRASGSDSHSTNKVADDGGDDYSTTGSSRSGSQSRSQSQSQSQSYSYSLTSSKGKSAELSAYDDGQQEGSSTSSRNAVLPATSGAVQPFSPNGEQEEHAPAAHRKIETFFREKYAPFVVKFRYIILGVAIVLFGVFVGLATRLKPSEDPARFLPDNHPVQRAVDAATYDFPADEGVVTASIVFGLDEVDREGTDWTVWSDWGEPVFLDDFDPSPAEAQQFIIDTCESARDLDSVRNREVACPLEYLRDYRQSRNESFPVPQEDFADVVLEFAHFAADNLVQNRPSTGIFTTDVAGEGIGSLFRFDTDGNLLFMQAVANLTLTLIDPEAKSRPAYENWQEWVDERNEDERRPGDIMQVSSKWVEMETETVLLRSMINGAILALALAFVIVLVATDNIIITTFSMICIIWTLAMLFGLITIFGWDIDIIVSVLASISTGLSVDFTVHLAAAYLEAHEDTRYERIVHSLTAMATPVFSAALTTLAASAVLLGTIVQFFVKFGIFICSVIALSAIAAYFLLFAILAIVGPQGNTGKVSYYVRKCIGKPKADE